MLNLSRRLIGFDPFLGANPIAASWKETPATAYRERIAVLKGMW